MTIPLLAILAHTPIWVWGLLAVLVALGVNQMRTRDLPAARVVALPIVLAALSAAGALHAFSAAGEAATLATWLGGALLGASSNRVLGLPRRCRANADGSFRVEGSLAPLVLMVAIFLVHYVANVALAFHPARAADPAFALPATLAYALPAGLLAARARRIWVSRRAGAPLATA